MRAASISARTAAAGPLRSRRVLALLGDERLVDQIRRGNETAFEIAFERHGPAILGFCRHMLASPEEAEDVVQHTFAAAFRELRVDDSRHIALKPWLFTIARNRCLSLLRARRELAVGEPERVPATGTAGAIATAGLADQVEQRADLRRLLADVRELPDEQRAALLLAEVGDLSHAEVAGVLGCEVRRVKALVFRARSALIARRQAREIPCGEIREQLANLRGGSLRRTELRLHLRDCPGCSAYREEVRQQRRMLAAALPVAPSLGLKSTVLAAVGIGGGSAGGGAAAVGLAGGAGAALTKLAVVGALAGGGVVAGNAVVDSGVPGGAGSDGALAAPETAGNRAGGAAAAGETGPRSGARRPGAGRKSAPERARGDRGKAKGERRRSSRARDRRSARAETGPPGLAKPKQQGRRRGHERKAAGDGVRGGEGQARGRGPIEAPPPTTPVKRGPPETQPQPGKPPQAKADSRAEAPAAAPLPVLDVTPTEPPQPDTMGRGTEK